MSAHEQALRNVVANQAAEWIAVNAEGKPSAEQVAQFMRWLRSSPMHVSEYLALLALNRSVAEAARKGTESIEELLAAEEDLNVVALARTAPANAAMRASAQRQHASRTRRRRVLGWTLAGAASIFALAVIWHEFPLSDVVSQQRYAASAGEQRHFLLADGTAVDLDTDSQIRVIYGGHSRRVVVDRGQAFFDVAKDSARPFAVQVGDYAIRDVGTAFNVAREGGESKVTVKNGSVEISKREKEPARSWFRLPWGSAWGGVPIAKISDGQQALLDDSGRVQTRNVNLRGPLAWTSGNIEFDDRSIAVVAADFNRYNRTRIDIADRRVGELRISGSLGVHDLDNFVAFLNGVPGIAAKAEGGNRIVVRARSIN